MTENAIAQHVQYAEAKEGLIYFDKQSSELSSCVKVEVAVLGSTSLIVLTGLCGRKATLNQILKVQSSGAV